MAGFQLSTRRGGSCVGLLVGLGAALTLVGCGAPEQTPRAVATAAAAAVRTVPEPSTRTAASEVGATAFVSRSTASSDSPPPAAPLPPSVAPPALELVGTSIDAGTAFAVLKGPDGRAVTVREGDQVDGYTIASIEPDRVKMRSPGNGPLFLMRLDATTGNPGAQANGTSHVGTDLITEGVNTDQSLPEHPTFGPTGQLPEGRRQIGH